MKSHALLGLFLLLLVSACFREKITPNTRFLPPVDLSTSGQQLTVKQIGLTPPHHFVDFAFLDANRGVAIIENQNVDRYDDERYQVFRTEDGGDTWKARKLPEKARLRRVFALGRETFWLLGYQTGSNGGCASTESIQWRSLDGGKNWQADEFSLNGTWLDPQILRNGMGLSYFKRPIPIQPNDCFSLDSDVSFYATSNGGVNWDLVNGGCQGLNPNSPTMEGCGVITPLVPLPFVYHVTPTGGIWATKEAPSRLYYRPDIHTAFDSIQLPGNLGTEAAFVPIDDLHVFVSEERTGNSWISKDGGQSWRLLPQQDRPNRWEIEPQSQAWMALEGRSLWIDTERDVRFEEYVLPITSEIAKSQIVNAEVYFILNQQGLIRIERR